MIEREEKWLRKWNAHKEKMTAPDRFPASVDMWKGNIARVYGGLESETFDPDNPQAYWKAPILPDNSKNSWYQSYG
jgi:hypothetical protein